MAHISGDMEFSLYGRELDELVERVSQFKYLVIPLDQSNNYWTEILWDVMRAQKVWAVWERYCGGRGEIHS